MTSPTLLLLAPLLAVTFGYEPSADSTEGYDYTVQVEPELFERMKSGEADAIEANIPNEVSPIRRIRVIVGNEPLAKKLRPTATARTTYRQDLDAAASPSIDLLAQTGPAGGFGRNATGFNNGSLRNTAPPTNNTTLPPVVPTNTQPTSLPATQPNTNPNYTTNPNWTTTQPTTTTNPTSIDLQQQLDQGFQAANNTINNAADSMRAGINQTIQNTQDAFTNSTTGLQPLPVTSATPQWSNTNTTQPYRQGEQSMLNNQPTSNPNTQPAITSTTNTQQETNEQYWDRVQRERQEQAELQARNNPNMNTQFPQQPMQSQPTREQNNNIVRPLVDTSLNAVDNRMPAGNNAPAIGSTNNAFGNSNPATSGGLTSFGDPYDRALDPAGNNRGTTQIVPIPIPVASNPASTQSTNRPNTESWAPAIQQAGATGGAGEAAKGANLPAAVWAWAIALGAVVVNMYQWLNIVDMRNKYRVALRRTSPNFARSMAA
jgi:hypothetical protein